MKRDSNNELIGLALTDAMTMTTKTTDTGRSLESHSSSLIECDYKELFFKDFKASKMHSQVSSTFKHFKYLFKPSMNMKDWTSMTLTQVSWLKGSKGLLSDFALFWLVSCLYWPWPLLDSFLEGFYEKCCKMSELNACNGKRNMHESEG